MRIKSLAVGAVALAAAGFVASAVQAGDLPALAQASAQAPAAESTDPFLVRVRALGVVPVSGGDSLGAGPLAGAQLQNNVVPEVDFTYFLNKHWAIEAIAGVAHSRLTAPAGLGSNIGVANTTLLPATAALQYHFARGAFDPYLGAGVNYTWFLATKSPYLAAHGADINGVNIRPSAGLALQAGFDYYLSQHWTLNVDVKKVFLRTDANVNAPGLGANAAHINVDPWLFGVGVGYRFGAGDNGAPAKY